MLKPHSIHKAYSSTTIHKKTSLSHIDDPFTRTFKNSSSKISTKITHNHKQKSKLPLRVTLKTQKSLQSLLQEELQERNPRKPSKPTKEISKKQQIPRNNPSHPSSKGVQREPTVTKTLKSNGDNKKVPKLSSKPQPSKQQKTKHQKKVRKNNRNTLRQEGKNLERTNIIRDSQVEQRREGELLEMFTLLEKPLPVFLKPKEISHPLLATIQLVSVLELF